MPAIAERISAREARSRVDSDEALLVCAYDDDEKCRKYYLDGAIPMSEFREMEDSLPRDREIIFYCA
jgi:hypothetical protein